MAEAPQNQQQTGGGRPDRVVPPKPQMNVDRPKDLKLVNPETIVTEGGVTRIKTGEQHLLDTMDGTDLEVTPTMADAFTEAIPDACKWYQSKACPPEHRRHYMWALPNAREVRDRKKVMVVSVRNHSHGHIPGAPGLHPNDVDANGMITGPLGALFFKRASVRKAEIDKAMGIKAAEVDQALDGQDPLFPGGKESNVKVTTETKDAEWNTRGGKNAPKRPQDRPVEYDHHPKNRRAGGKQ